MKSTIKFLKNCQWEEFYREPAHVLGIYMAMENRTKLMKKNVGVAFKAAGAKIQNNFFTLYVVRDDWARVANYILKKIIKEKGWMEKIFRGVYDQADNLVKFSRKLRSLKYQKLNNRALFLLYEGFVSRFIMMRLYSSQPTNVELHVPVFTFFLQNLLKKYIDQGQKEFNEVFSVMTTPEKDSYLRKKDIEFLKLCLQYNSSNFSKKLSKFTNEYTWVNYTFQGAPITQTDFLKEVKQKIKEGCDFNAEIKKISEQRRILKKEKRKIITEYHFSKEIVRFFNYASEFVYIKYFRKGIFAESYYNCEFLLKEIAKRLGADLNTVQGMLFDEVKSALLDNKVDINNIKKRIESGVLLFIGGKSFDLSGTEKNIFLDNVDTKIIDADLELKGQVAMSGTAIGKVRIINGLEDLSRMKVGDIMVSRSTNPQLLPAMKKCAGIITDMGGLTCHAAIVARELKKPCVVGTKYATSVLKEGEMVEVDAYKGVVRKIN